MDSLEAQPQSDPRRALAGRDRLRRFLRLLPLIVILFLISVGAVDTNGCSTDQVLFDPGPLDLRPSGTDGGQLNVNPSVNNNALQVWIDLGFSGIYTPTQGSQTTWLPWQALAQRTSVETLLDEVADKGYFALRVPDLLGQTTRIVSPTVNLNYYSPPDSPTRTSVPITVTRLVTYEAGLTSRFGTDGQSHWEAWWLPPGARFPLPSSPVRFREDVYPTPVSIEFRLYFGPGSNSRDAIGRKAYWAMYNGYTFIGPIEKTIVAEEPPGPTAGPLVAFGGRCNNALLEARTLVQEIQPDVPFTHTFCLENYDTVTRIFTIDASSSQDWPYAYRYRSGAGSGVAGGLPFTVSAGPATSLFPFAGVVNVHAVYTPTIASAETFRETLAITATSVVSPSVQARDYSFALAPSYQLNEGSSFSIYLPVILREN